VRADVARLSVTRPQVPKLSVVTPFFNVEPYLGAALESIAAQTMDDLEVIMVDDGSADGSTAIAKSFAARDERFHLVQQENQGLGPARNTGTKHATGAYLAFFDSDDLLAPHAYETLVGSLEKTGSDMACGGVRRFNPAGIYASPMHRAPFQATVLRTHVSRYHALMHDWTAWNKVIRRSFWDSCGLEFPSGLYEDLPVMVPAHVMASCVDAFRDVIYYYRDRQSGELSISQRARDLSNNEQRMSSVRAVGAFLTSRAPELKPVFDRCVFEGDLAILVGAFRLVADTDRERLLDLASEYLATVDESVYQQVDTLKRLRYHLIRRRMLPELLEVMRYTAQPGAAPEMVRRGIARPTWYAAYPYFGDRAAGVPDQIYEAAGEMTLNARLDDVTWHDGRLRITGRAYIRRLDAPAKGDTRIHVRLRNHKLHRTIRLPVERVYRPDVTALSNQTAACYDWSGFTAELDPKRLATLGSWRAAAWELRVRVSGRGVRREGPVTGVEPGPAKWPEGRWAAEGVWLQPAPEDDGSFNIRARRIDAFVTSCHPEGDALEMSGWATGEIAAGAALVISRRQSAKRIRIPIETSSPETSSPQAGRTGFRARLPLATLTAAHTVPTALERALPSQDQIAWDLSLDPGRGAVRLGASAEAAGVQVSDGGREITTTLTPFGSLTVMERSCHLLVSQAEWTSDGQLLLTGDQPTGDQPTGDQPTGTQPTGDSQPADQPAGDSQPADQPAGDSQPAELVLRRSGSNEQHVVDLTWEGNHFSAQFNPAVLPTLAGRLPLGYGKWDLLARAGGREFTVAVHPGRRRDLPGYRRAGMHEVAVEVHQADALRLSVRIGYADDERGSYAQHRLRQRDYPAAISRPLRDLAVFESYGGQQYSCNPRAIYEELRRRAPGLECAWVTSDGQFTGPTGAKQLVAGTREYYEAVAQARYLVSNDLLPRWYRKREGQFYVQTWHGTPLKRIGHDIEPPRLPNTVAYLERQDEDSPKWDLLLSPNAFSTPIFRSAFAFDGEIAETGYPRNDILRSPEGEERAAQARKRLGIPAGKRVVMYAPTWRDDAFQQGGRYRFDMQLDLDALSRALSDDHVILLRTHFNVRDPLSDSSPDSGLVDVTRYPDIADLYLISDVLITDYSSAMFDFAVTGRPMLFFTYDLERYRDKLRGFYFDFETDAPGPLLRGTADVIDALREIDQVATARSGAYDAFTARFCALDDGRASARVVDRLLAAPQPG
jgi:CDP-glycerol glycerophosphotransferase